MKSKLRQFEINKTYKLGAEAEKLREAVIAFHKKIAIKNTSFTISRVRDGK